ncbi:MAG TPA: LemA family protein [Abditibacteriaceae bacterium]|jgi:LemA protein
MEIYILLAVVLLPIVVIIGMYNGLVSRRNGVDNAFASLDASLQKRFDLVPNLVATVKGYATHERELFEHVATLRAQSQTARGRLEADSEMSALLPQIMAIAEGYPQLKASANFLHLQATMNELEEQISASRRAFNAAVTDYNTAIQSFPQSILANSFGFTARDLFACADAARNAPTLAGQF